MEDNSKQVFDELFEDQANNYCFECGAPSNHWASVNNAIFLCLNCSGLHRGFGVHVSFVRSVTMDSWSDLQLSMMKNGGNAKLKSFFESYNMPKDAPNDFRYKTKAGQYYRDMIKAKSEGKDAPEPPSPEEGLELLEFEKKKQDMSGFGSTPQEEPKNDIGHKVLGFLGKAADVTVKTTKNVAKGVTNTVTDPNLKQNAANFGHKVADGTKTFVGKVGDSLKTENLKQVGGKIGDGAKKTASYVGTKSKEIWDDKEVIAKKTADAIGTGFKSTWGFFKGLTGKKKEEEIVLEEKQEIQEVEIKDEPVTDEQQQEQQQQ